MPITVFLMLVAFLILFADRANVWRTNRKKMKEEEAKALTRELGLVDPHKAPLPDLPTRVRLFECARVIEAYKKELAKVLYEQVMHGAKCSFAELLPDAQRYHETRVLVVVQAINVLGGQTAENEARRLGIACDEFAEMDRMKFGNVVNPRNVLGNEAPYPEPLSSSEMASIRREAGL